MQLPMTTLPFPEKFCSAHHWAEWAKQQAEANGVTGFCFPLNQEEDEFYTITLHKRPAPRHLALNNVKPDLWIPYAELFFGTETSLYRLYPKIDGKARICETLCYITDKLPTTPDWDFLTLKGDVF